MTRTQQMLRWVTVPEQWAEKWGLLRPFRWRELGPDLTQCRLGLGIPQYQVVTDTSSSLATIDMDQKLGSCCAPIWGSWVSI